MSVNNINKGALIAEFIGTFGLALAVLVSLNGYLPLVPTAVVAGATLVLFVLTIGAISGSHINPAVTIGLLSVKKIELSEAFGYIVAQIAGALTAWVTMSLLLNGELVAQVVATADARVFSAETLGAFIFGFGIAAAIHHKLDGFGKAFAIGGSLTLGIIFASVVSNGVLNPAVAMSIESVNWAYVLGPIVGMILGMNAFAYFLTPKNSL